jgi:FtsP/CotA-like multicopper oxidase with cupredoxin domain
VTRWRVSLALLACVGVAGAALVWGAVQSRAAASHNGVRAAATKAVMAKMAAQVTPSQRQAAANRLLKSLADLPVAKAVMNPGGTPDYFGTVPNYANSPLPVKNRKTGRITGGIRKFVDSLPGLGKANKNDLGQYLPVAVPDTTTYPGSDYYEIAVVQFKVRMSKDLPPTTVRGYVQLETGVVKGAHYALTYPNGSPILDSQGNQVYAVDKPQYLGPAVVAQRDRPVRAKIVNYLPTGAAGNLFLPVDTTIMGAGLGPNGGTEMYTQNRIAVHLHGGVTPWISDGTPHQWITPAGEVTSYAKGVSVQNVPDMPDPGPGAVTLYWTNQQSARMMFFHDHAYGITRLNVYAGMAAPYLLGDAVEQELIKGNLRIPLSKRKIKAAVVPGTIPAAQIPLAIEDKTFVPKSAQLAKEDPTWDSARYGGYGNLWFPHVYMPNQNPSDAQGVNAMGRWDYGPWFWPPYTGLTNGPVPNPLAGKTPEEGPVNPGTPNPSIVPEAFMDTMTVNGTAYPVLKVQPKAYRFRILNASNDRTLNLQLYYADPRYKPGQRGYGTEVRMVPALPHTGLPARWPTDARVGGVPDPKLQGPAMIQIGNEGGFLPNPVRLLNTPVGYVYNRRDITVLNVSNKTLFLGPAERADVIVDFSHVKPGSRLILYNDAPAPVPGFDPRYDYYTGDPDQRSTGGAPRTLVGYGPNTRTIMQIRVTSGKPAKAFNYKALQKALPKAYAADQDAPIVPEAAYNMAYGTQYTNTYAHIQDTALSFTPVGASAPITLQMQPKAIQELFDTDYGRMNATLGVELPFTNATIQTTIPYGYVDPPTETIQNSNPMTLVGSLGDGTQIWKITHNGVDTHAIHVHLFTVQLIDRVGWDGAIRPPDPNEFGWKETVRMNPLEDAIVALRPVAPKLPFGIPDSVRPLDPAMPLGTTTEFTGVDPNGRPITVTNQVADFGWEYVWHCHLLGHEENDMMRPIVFEFQNSLPAPPVVTATGSAGNVQVSWTDGTPAQDPSTPGNPSNEIGFRILRAEVTGGIPGTYAQIGTALANTTSFTDSMAAAGTTYSYEVVAYNQAGDSTSAAVQLSL